MKNNDKPKITTVSTRVLFERAAMEMGPQQFRPVAYYNPHLDLIRVVLRNCSVREERKNKWLTVLYDLYPKEGQSPCMGVVIKGARHLLGRLQMADATVYHVVDIINAALKKIPSKDRDRLTGEIEPCLHVVRDTEMEMPAPEELEGLEELRAA